MDTKLINILKNIGLTEYESKAYVTLSNLVIAKADEISKQSDVPRSKIYSVLDSLEEKKLIIIEKGRPLKYQIIPPNESLKIKKDELIRDFEYLEKHMQEVYDQKLDTVNTPITTIEDPSKIIQKEYNIIDRTKKVLFIRLGFIIPSEIDNFRKTLKKLVKRGVSVKILANKECTIDNEVISMEELLKDIKDVKFVKLPAAQLFIRDNKEMILIFAENSSKSLSNARMVAMWNSYSIIVSNYAMSFNKQWSNNLKFIIFLNM